LLRRSSAAHKGKDNMRRLALLFLLSASFIACNSSQSPALPQWEYKVLPASLPRNLKGDSLKEALKQSSAEELRFIDDPEAVLNELGAQGWELVGFDEGDARRYVLKRKKEQK
jgi:hypothetical protein